MIELKLPWKLTDCILPSDADIINAGGDLISTNAEYFSAIVHRVSTYDQIVEALEAAKEFVRDYVDVVDGSYGEPAPNKAMAIYVGIDAALEAAKRGGGDV